MSRSAARRRSSAATPSSRRSRRPTPACAATSRCSSSRWSGRPASARRAFCGNAARGLSLRPLVLLFEDLHWADAALLDFLDHLLDWSLGVPILVLCTARPELYELHRSWGGGKRNSTTVSLSPLPPDDTARLLHALLDQSVLPAETQTLLLERCGGNPLYAEQFARMLADSTEDLGVPVTVQAVISARLDSLGAERKALLQDAAVIGKVFWAEAVAAVSGRDERTVQAALVDLAH